jgi:DNA helicase-2/ATP-dependent DNA helicase PcrA
MDIVADLHVHSKYARAVSKYLDLEALAAGAMRKGVDLLATGDWTHPAWFGQLEAKLDEVRPGIFQLLGTKPEFVLGTEIACIYRQGGRLRRIHHLVFVPSLDACRRFSDKLAANGADLTSDGRPVTELSSIQLFELVGEVGGNLVPAHLWTPWFGTFGSKTGFDSLAECFGPYVDQIRAVETGLSSDPAMNWGVPELADRTIVSFSDAHSAPKLAREATVLRGPLDFDFVDVMAALTPEPGRLKIAHTLEFFPEEGKYHWSGHRAHGVRFSPAQDQAARGVCPVCKRPVTIGVENRAEALGGLLIETRLETDIYGQTFVHDAKTGRPPFASLVTLLEIAREALGSPTRAQRLCDELALETPELETLMRTPLEVLERTAGTQVAQGISNMRRRQVRLDQGYDGVFGSVGVI